MQCDHQAGVPELVLREEPGLGTETDQLCLSSAQVSSSSVVSIMTIMSGHGAGGERQGWPSLLPDLGLSPGAHTDTPAHT